MARGTTFFGRLDRLPASTQTIRVLGERLGPVRIKVAQKRDDGFLRLLLDSLDPHVRWALDFRHESWDEPEIDARLVERGVARVNVLESGATFRYLRLREPPYDDDALAELGAKIQPLVAAGVDVYAYFRHEDAPTAPAYAERLLELVGRSARR
jgi:uncharacterized protein YecE (DUF72 family)